jgi:3-oxoacyl-[acyl-carrier protein] reductase
MNLNLKDKVALVTGGSHGLGRSVCLALAAEGAKVAVNYRRNPRKAEDLEKEIHRDFGVETASVYASVADRTQVSAMFDAAEAKLGLVQILINNAALSPSSFIQDTSEEIWDETIQTNLTGTFYTCREMVKRLLAAEKTGRIVNVSSTAAYLGSTSGRTHYDATKGAVVSFTISLAREMSKHNIAVNAVAPGLMFTEMTADRLETNRERYLARIPAGRFGETEEIADVIVFLASERASYMTGTVINVSGGLLMG